MNGKCAVLMTAEKFIQEFRFEKTAGTHKSNE